MRLLLPLLLTACGESWTWDATGANKDSGGDTAVPDHDLDGDGFTGIAAGGDDCWDDPSSIPAGFGAISGTAQPTAAEVHPDATETWYDAVDQNCAGDDDFDQDGDTHRSATHADGTGAAGDDCYDAVDDAYPSGAASCAREGELAPSDVNPGATDAAYDGTDADCSGNDDFDQDNDGFGSCAECDDTNASIYPNDEPDVWYDGVDTNCDGNDGDQDGDGYCLAGYVGIACAAEGDCLDTDATVHPDAADVWYDGTDGNCLGDDDFDQDGDGYALADDCDDTVATTFPGAPDAWYDGVDADCADNDDFDQDGDGYSTDDCDDLDVGVNAAAAEDCATAYDDDCDGDDNDPDATGCVNYYSDLDGDGYGAASECLCAATATYSLTTGDDCDDADAAVSPAETEVCNDGVDNDCDGGAGGCGLTGGSLAGADAIWTGEAANDKAGISVSGAGDINGDGFDDVLVGAYTNADGGYGAGAAYLVLGGASLTSASLGAAIEYTGVNAGDAAGVSVSGAGDVDADGFADLVIGAHANSDAATGAGAAYLVFGSAAPSSSRLVGAVQYTGEAANDTAGVSVSRAGDVNGDGYSDFLIGARMNSNAGGLGAGAAYIVLGSATAATASLSTALSFTGEFEYNLAGASVSTARDVDGDGLDDVLIGAVGNADGGGAYAGAAYLLLGSSAPASASLGTAVQYTGEAANDYAGEGVSSAGDVDGDGYGDVLIAAPYNDDGGSDAGAAYLVLGSSFPVSASLATAVQYTGVDTSNYAGGSASRGKET